MAWFFFGCIYTARLIRFFHGLICTTPVVVLWLVFRCLIVHYYSYAWNILVLRIKSFRSRVATFSDNK